MANKQATTRLKKELVAFHKDPPPFIQVAVDEKNMLNWDYLLEGPPDSPYHTGWYHGKLRFPKDYPFKPPEILMLTPSGRFQINTPLCLSMSSFHPETWNPMWSVGTVLTGLLSFMLENTPTTGAIETSDACKKQYALESLAFNLKQPAFLKSFPHMKSKATQIEASVALPLPTMDNIGAAEAAFAKGDHQETIRCCTAALAEGPDTQQKIHILRTRSASRMFVNDIPGALEDSLALLVLQENDGPAHLQAAKCLLSMGKPEECRKHLQSAEASPSSVDSSSNGFSDQYRRVDEAQSALDALQQLPNTADAHAALEVIGNALVLCPASVSLQNDKAEMLIRLGDFEAAIQTLEGIPREGQDAAAKRTRQVQIVMEKKKSGNAAFGQGDWRTATKAYTQAINMVPSAVFYANYAAVLQRQEKYSQAIEQCTLALRWDSRHQKALGRRAACHMALKKRKEAVEDYIALCKLDPANKEYQRLLQQAQADASS